MTFNISTNTNFSDATNTALSLTTSANGHVWLYDSATRNIKEYAANGAVLNYIQSVAIPGVYTTVSLAADTVSGDIYGWFRAGLTQHLYKISNGVATELAVADTLSAISVDAQGKIWGAGLSFVKQYEVVGGALTLVQSVVTPQSNSAIAVDARGDVWVVTTAGNLYEISATTHTPVLVATGLGAGITSLQVNSAGTALWVPSGSSVRAYVTDPVASTATIAYIKTVANPVKSIVFDANHNLWVSSTSNTGGLVELITNAVSNTVATVALSADTGTSATDFVTNTATQTISGTLSAPLANNDNIGIDTVQVSLDNGVTWAAATTTGTNWSLANQTLSAASVIRVKVQNFEGNSGSVLSQAYVLDTSAPTLSSVNVPTNGTYGIGQALNFSVHFSEAVTVNTTGGTPYIALTLDTGTVNASYISGSGSQDLIFRYVVAAGNQDVNGVALGTTLVANGGSVADTAGNALANTNLVNVGATTGILVDGRVVAPVINAGGVTLTSGPVTASPVVSGSSTLMAVGAVNALMGTAAGQQLMTTSAVGTVAMSQAFGTQGSASVTALITSAQISSIISAAATGGFSGATGGFNTGSSGGFAGSVGGLAPVVGVDAFAQQSIGATGNNYFSLTDFHSSSNFSVSSTNTNPLTINVLNIANTNGLVQNVELSGFAGIVIVNNGVNASGLNGNNLLVGLGGGVYSFDTGNHTLCLLGPNATVNGNSGVNVVNMMGVASAGAVLSQQGNDITIWSDWLATGSGVTRLHGVERVAFSDGIVAYDNAAGQNGGEVFRIYEAAFDRAADQTGMGYWLNQLDNNLATLESIATQFINSNEFKAIYGADLTNSQFVYALYNNVLGRGPDAAGSAYWLEQLQNGMTKAQLLINFSESNEGVAYVASLVANGIHYQQYVES